MVFVSNPYPECPDEESILENCCVCRKSCNTWYKPKDVAMCPDCAKIVKEADIPDKLDWIIKEQFLDEL